MILAGLKVAWRTSVSGDFFGGCRLGDKWLCYTALVSG